MKTKAPSPSESLRIKDHSSQRKSVRWLPSAILAAGAILVFCLVNGAADAGATDFCRLTSQLALQSCRSGAQSDYWLALGKCENLADPAAREACNKQALADLKDAVQTCKD